MEKLELKHLVGYLPYSLNILYWNGNAKEYIDILQVLHLETKNVLGSDKHKPILRPLSDLTKDIEHDGEKFVPIEYNAFKESKKDIIEFISKYRHYKSIKYGIIERLFEWHFDIFGLIEKGLAIDINTLNERV